MGRRIFLGLLLTVLVLSLAPLYAGPVTPGVYQLLNHPAGALTATHGPYGLRGDFLPPPGPGPTFSFDPADGAGMFLTWTGGTTAVIEGTLWNNAAGELWSIMYTITGISVVGGANGGFTATGGSGTLFPNATMTADGTEEMLTGKQDSSGVAFRFLGDGHRLDSHGGTGTEEVGRGWLDADGTNDFLFTATKVPEPTSVLLLATGLALLAIGRWMI